MGDADIRAQVIERIDVFQRLCGHTPKFLFINREVSHLVTDYALPYEIIVVIRPNEFAELFEVGDIDLRDFPLRFSGSRSGRHTVPGQPQNLPKEDVYVTAAKEIFEPKEPCTACGKDTLDVGWECTECGNDDIDVYGPKKIAAETLKAASALDHQEGGDHYKNLPIQPIEYITRNEIPYLEGNVIKYVTRHATKHGREDLLKARHYIDLILEMRYGQ